MKQIITAAILALSGVAFAQAVYVAPHVTKNGTLVEGHYRTAPNATKMDNYSTQGNVNPFTGAAGTVSPYPATTYSPPTYTPPQPSRCYTTKSGQFVCR